MQPRTTRSFRISDALVLVAATAFGLAGCRFWLSLQADTARGDLWPAGVKSTFGSLWLAAVGVVPLASILLLSWSTAVLLLRLRSPRPRRRRLWCQPGFLACIAPVFFFTSTGVTLLVFSIAGLLKASPDQLANINLGHLILELSFSFYITWLFNPIITPQAYFGEAVVLVWLVTWASGRWRPEPSWVDRSGRLLGAAWVGISLLAFSAILK